MVSPLRAVIVDTEMRNIVGGAQTFLLRLLPQLEKRGIQCCVVTEGYPQPGFARTLRQAGVEVEAQLWPYPSLVEEAAGLLADRVHSMGARAYIVSASAGVGWAALPLLSHEVATLSIAHADTDAFYGPVRHYGPFLSCAIGVGAGIGDRLRRELGRLAHRVQVVPYGVPVISRHLLEERLLQRRRDGCLEVAFVGRLIRTHKRIQDLVEVIRALRMAPVRFRVIGDGPDGPWFRAAVAPEVATGRVVLEGWLSLDAVQERLASADAVLLTSDSEGLPIAVLEGLGNGLAAVVTDIPATRPLIEDGRVGRLIPVGFIPGFADCLRNLAAEPTRREQMRRAALALGAQFSVEAMAESYATCIRDALTLTRRGPETTHPLLPSCRSRFPMPVRKAKLRAQRQWLRMTGFAKRLGIAERGP